MYRVNSKRRSFSKLPIRESAPISWFLVFISFFFLLYSLTTTLLFWRGEQYLPSERSQSFLKVLKPSGILTEPCRQQSTLRIAILTTYVPQYCGIAEFAYEILKALKLESENLPSSSNFPKLEIGILVLNPEEYKDFSYGDDAVFVIRKQVLEDYFLAADFANRNYDVVLCEHEFGIFGGTYGDYLFGFLNKLRLPIVVTMHTVLSRGESRFEDLEYYDAHLKALLPMATSVTVALQSLCSDLDAVFKGTADKCNFIPHGIPTFVPNTSAVLSKYGKKLKDSLVILTAGLIGPSKGIGFMIEAMSNVSKVVPNAKYFVVGKQHPLSGFDYQLTLQSTIYDSKVDRNVELINEYMEKENLEAWMSLADLVVLPYIDPEQVSSGALSMAMGLGRAVVSTRFRYSIHMCEPDSLAERAWLAETEKIGSKSVPESMKPIHSVNSKGKFCRLVERENATDLSLAVSEILLNSGKRRELESLALERTSEMSWNQVAKKVLRLCLSAVKQKVNSSSLQKEVDRLFPESLLGEVEESERSVYQWTPELKQKVWNETFITLKALNPSIEVLSADLLLPFVKIRTMALQKVRSQAVMVLQSLSYAGLSFSNWRPPSKNFSFQINKNGIFLLKDNTKSIHGNLKDGSVILSRSEHGLVFGRGFELDWPKIKLEALGKHCSFLETTRNMSWGSMVNSSTGKLWSKSRVVCIHKEKEFQIGTLKHEIVAVLDDPFVQRIVEFEISPEEKSYVPSLEVSSVLDQLGARFRGVHYTRFFTRTENGSGDALWGGDPVENLYLKQPEEPSPSWYLLTNEEWKNGIFVFLETQEKLQNVKIDERRKKFRHRADAYDALHNTYLFEEPEKISRLSEKFLVTGVVDVTRLAAYQELFNKTESWTGIDFSLQEEKLDILREIERYWYSLKRRSKEAKELIEWLREQGSLL